MAREVATRWILGIVIYFIILSLIFTVSNSIASDYGLDTNSSLSSTGGRNTLEELSIGECTNPRFYNLYVEPSPSSSLVPNNQLIANEGNINYEILTEFGYITDPNVCEGFVGAEWSQKTFLTIPYGDEKCLGVINLTHYNEGVFFSDVNLFNFISNQSLTVCDLSSLNNDPYTCQKFGCLYVTAENKDDISGIISSRNPFTILGVITSTIIDVITLRINFGFDSSLLNGTLTFMFIWLPIILLIISIYVMIR